MPSLSGKVVVDGGEVASGAVVEIHNASGDVVDQVQVDPQGHFLYHLTPGEWTLQVWDNHGHRGRCDVTLGAEDQIKDIDIGRSESR